MIFVAIGGFFGAIARYQIGLWMTKLVGNSFPWGTLVINVVGSFLLGICFGIQPQQFLIFLFATGFLGAFTTFSTFSYEAIQLFVTGKPIRALLYIVVSFSFSVCATAGAYLFVIS